MRILRIRRGYTTNSSGENEWVPPALSGTASAKKAPSKTPPPAASSAKPALDAGVAPTATATATASAVAPVVRRDAGPAPLSTVEPDPPAAAPPPPAPVDQTSSNVGQLGCIGFAVVFLSMLGWRIAKKRKAPELEGD